jgi:uncharacterized delta-60 repeat protein
MNATKFRLAPRGKTVVLIALLLLITVSSPARPSPGDIDPSFGVAGKSGNGLNQQSEILALAIQTDGKIIAVGNVGSPRSFLISRYNADGSLDASFGSAGNAMTNFSAGPSSANAVAIQSDGKIVVAGYAGALFALTRYNSNGALDQSFGSAGMVTGLFDAAHIDTLSLGSSVAIQSDGKIVIVGDSFALNPQAREYALDCNFGIARYNSDGMPDETFGIAGIVISDFGSFDRAHALAIKTAGKILIAGDSNSTGTGPYTMLLVRYNTDGTLDATFGSGGRAVAITGSFEVSALALRADEKIMVAGTYTTASPAYADFAVARFNSDGTPDATFGSGGSSVTDFAWASASRDNRAFALALQPNGKILLGGYSDSTFALARYNADGGLDESFGTAGIAVAQVSAIGSSTISFPIAGSTSSSSVFGSSVSIGIIDISHAFPPAGVRLDLLRAEQAFALGVQPSGKIVAGGVVDGRAALARYHSATTPKLTVANVGMPLPHGDSITFKPPNGFTTVIDLRNVPQIIDLRNVPQTGIGGIVSLDNTISCGTRCSAAYDTGRTVILNAVWPAGSYFVGWDGCAPISGGGCAITMDQDAAVAANFEPDLPFTADSSILPDAEVGLRYDIASGIGGGRQPIAARVVSGKPPSGLSFRERKLGGIPLTSGKSKFTVDFTDASGLTVRKSFGLTIYKPLNISTAALKKTRLAKNYAAPLKVSGGKAPYRWTIASGALPDGLQLDQGTGRIAGIPTRAGTYDFTVRVKDALGQQFDRVLTLIAY